MAAIARGIAELGLDLNPLDSDAFVSGRKSGKGNYFIDCIPRT
jgi:hypothetical protein